MDKRIKKNLASCKIKPKRALCVSMFRRFLNLGWDVIAFLKLVTGENLTQGKHASFCLPALFR